VFPAGTEAAPRYAPATSSRADFEASVAAEVERRVQEELARHKILKEVKQLEEEFRAQQGQAEAEVVAVAGPGAPEPSSE
jgi:hypothetical protein